MLPLPLPASPRIRMQKRDGSDPLDDVLGPVVRPAPDHPKASRRPAGCPARRAGVQNATDHARQRHLPRDPAGPRITRFPFAVALDPLEWLRARVARARVSTSRSIMRPDTSVRSSCSGSHSASCWLDLRCRGVGRLAFLRYLEARSRRTASRVTPRAVPGAIPPRHPLARRTDSGCRYCRRNPPLRRQTEGTCHCSRRRPGSACRPRGHR